MFFECLYSISLCISVFSIHRYFILLGEICTFGSVIFLLYNIKYMRYETL